MPNPARSHEALVERFVQGDPVPIDGEPDPFTYELKRLSRIGQLAAVSPWLDRLIRRDIHALLPFLFGEGCFVCSNDDHLPLWYFPERPGTRRWLFVRTKRYLRRQLTWEESDAIAAAVRIRARRRPASGEV